MSTGILNIRGDRFSFDHVLLVEAHDPSKNAANIPNPERFKGRVVFTDGDSKLIEQTPGQFADEHQFRHLAGPDDIAVNPAIKFSVREFKLEDAQKKIPPSSPQGELRVAAQLGERSGSKPPSHRRCGHRLGVASGFRSARHQRPQRSAS